MSFDIKWNLLDSNDSLKLKEFMNSRFESIERPDFLGPIYVSVLLLIIRLRNLILGILHPMLKYWILWTLLTFTMMMSLLKETL
jgi:hypothetical protein